MSDYLSNQAGFEFQPPHSIESERAVIGCILIDDLQVINSNGLVPGDFYEPIHRKIYSSILEIYRSSQPVDMISVANHLSNLGILAECGGAEYLSGCQNDVSSPGRIGYYSSIVKKHSSMRKLVMAGRAIYEIGNRGELDIDEALEQAEKRIMSVSSDFSDGVFSHVSDVATKAIESINSSDGIGVNLTPTGFSELDGMLNGGFGDGDLIVLAARPSMGKTALSLELSVRAARDYRKSVGYVSLEMSKEQLIKRIACSMSGVSSREVRSGNMSEHSKDSMLLSMEQIKNYNIYMDDSMGGSMSELRSKIRRLNQKNKLDLVVIDYLQLMTTKGSGINRVNEVAEISRGLKLLAKELNIPIIVLSQLSRAVEKRDNKRPIMSDLRDSGAIEQDADVVMMLYRDEYYNQESDARGELEVLITKHRNGAVGNVRVMYDLQTQKFSDRDISYYYM